MKHIFATGCIILVLCALNAAPSCSLIGENDSSDTGISAPTVLSKGTSVIVTSAPIKDESFLSKVTYANIFRRSSTSSDGSASTDWTNIGQVSCAESGSTLTSFSFADDYVYSGYYYSYCVRYYNGSYYVYSDYSAWVQNTSGIGSQDITDEATVYYYGNASTSEYTLSLTLPEDGFSGLDTSFDSLCLILSNSSETRPFTLAAVSDGEVTATSAVVEAHKILPESFLDVELTVGGLVLFHTWQDEGRDFNFYRWTKPDLSLLTLDALTISENGTDVEIGTLSDDGTYTPASYTDDSYKKFTVPSIAKPENAFDASSLSILQKNDVMPSFRDERTKTACSLLDVTSF